MKTEIVETKAYIYKGERFWSLDEITKFKENEIIESCQCNNCMRYFATDDELESFEDEEGVFLGCPECKTDEYLMEYVKEELKC